MFKHRKLRTFIGAVLLGSGALFPTAQADLRPSILDGIADGTRVNTKVQVPLGQVPIPEPSNLYDFVKNKQRAIELGKALFWDMQVSSDGIQACASCHFNAGADPRTKNQLNPGLLTFELDPNTGTVSPAPKTDFEDGKGANYQLATGDFPHHRLTDPTLFATAELTSASNETTQFPSETVRSTNDVTSSQGVHLI